MVKTVSSSNQSSLNSLVDFHESFRQVDWPAYLEKAERSIDIVVYYWDQWISSHHHLLTKFLQKPNSKIRFFMADDSNFRLFEDIIRLFPKNTPELLKEKIVNTYMPLKSHLIQHNLPLSKLEVYKLPHLLNYSIVCIDEKKLILSFFEMYREEQIDAPACVIDLKDTHLLKKFINKELHGMRVHGKKML